MQKQKTEDKKRGQELRGSPDTYFNMRDVNAFLGRQRGEGSQPQKQIFAYVFSATNAIPSLVPRLSPRMTMLFVVVVWGESLGTRLCHSHPQSLDRYYKRGLKIHSASAIKVAFGITHATNTSPSLIAGLGMRLRQTCGKPSQWASYTSMVYHYNVMYHV